MGWSPEETLWFLFFLWWGGLLLIPVIDEARRWVGKDGREDGDE